MVLAPSAVMTPTMSVRGNGSPGKCSASKRIADGADLSSYQLNLGTLDIPMIADRGLALNIHVATDPKQEEKAQSFAILET